MHKIVIAITGASGSIYALRLLQKLMALPHEIEKIGIIMSTNAQEVWWHELGNRDYLNFSTNEANKPVCQFFDKNDFSAPFASGSAQYKTMIVVPCSMGTLSRIAQGTSNDLLTRAADVVLKERRRLILATRETPLNLIHIKNMELVTLAGGIICPATPSFYSKPQNLIEMADTVVDRLIDLAGLPQNSYRWGQ